jgi:hypothetical protein
MDKSETLTTLGTQETGRTMIDITLHRKKTYNPDDEKTEILLKMAINKPKTSVSCPQR